MPSAALDRLERLLESRRLHQTVILPGRRPEARVLSSGVALLDARLGGGWPKGEISELIGPRSSGRTGLLVATMASATATGGIVGLVDALDRFDPVMAARAGLDLDRVLWVRGQPLTVEGQRSGPWALLDRAVRQGVRAFDLIVRAGGFAVVALDVGDVPPRALGVLPFTTWLRLAHANEGRETVGLLVGGAPIGRSARGRTVRVEARRAWTGASRQSRRFTGFDIRLSA